MNKHQPWLFTLKPAFNKLESRSKVPIYQFKTGTYIIDSKNLKYKEFRKVDCDLWLQYVFSKIDFFRTRIETADSEIDINQFLLNFDCSAKTDFCNQLLQLKKKIAKIVSNLLVPVFNNTHWKVDNARLSVRDALVSDLTNYLQLVVVEYHRETNPIEIIATNELKQKTTNDILEPSLHLGQTDIPLVLKEEIYSPPELINHSQKKVDSSVSLNSSIDVMDYLLESVMWNYSFEYNETHFSQNQLEIEIDFNSDSEFEENLLDIRKENDVTESGFALAFAELANCVMLMPPLFSNLTEVILNYKFDNTDQSKTINDSLESIILLINNLVSVALQKNTAIQKQEFNERIPESSKYSYKFILKETTALIDGVKALIINIIIDAENETFAPFVEIDGYSTVKLNAPKGVNYSYCFKHITNNKLLLSEYGQTIRNRKISLPDLNIFEKSKANTSIRLVRNRALVADKPTNTDLVFNSELLSFNQACYPNIIVNDPLDITSVGSITENLTISDYLNNFFNLILLKNNQNTLCIKINCFYSSHISQALPIEIPVFLMLPTQLHVTDEIDTDKQTIKTQIIKLENTILRWFESNEPAGSDNAFQFKVLVFSSVINDQHKLFPLVEFSKISIPIKNIKGLGKK